MSLFRPLAQTTDAEETVREWLRLGSALSSSGGRMPPPPPQSQIEQEAEEKKNRAVGRSEES